MSEFQKAKLENLRKKTITLYRQGLTMREVAKIVGKSHTWVFFAVKKLSTFEPLDKNKQGVNMVV